MRLARGRGIRTGRARDQPVNWLDPLLYFASFAAIFVLFASAVLLVVWLLLRLRKNFIRLLGGRLKE